MLHACNQRFDVTENLEKFCELNKALVPKKICKIFQILRHIESLNAYIEY